MSVRVLSQTSLGRNVGSARAFTALRPAPACRQEAGAVVASSYSCTVTLSLAPTPGNVLIALGLYRNLLSLSQTGVTWTVVHTVTAASNPPAFGPVLAIGKVGASPSATCTATFSGNDYAGVSISEWTGLAGQLVATADSGTGYTTAATLPTFTYPRVRNGVVFGLIQTDNGTTRFDPYAGNDLSVMPSTATNAYVAWLNMGVLGFMGTSLAKDTATMAWTSATGNKYYLYSLVV